ncbi:unnamed protein product [Lota lota]
MRLLLAFLIQLVGVACRRPHPQVTHTQATGEVAVATAPRIHHCWSPNMEHFTCWWHPVGNVWEGEDVRYTLNYNKDKGPRHECPDYVSGGPNSCHFDRAHTSIWKVYCMTVEAASARRNSTSTPYCVDVADIVQTEAPVNLSCALREAGGDERGHSAVLSWSYPAPEDLRYGWITLVYELQYRRVATPDAWKVKPPQRESQLELMGLPVGEYLVRVRCRSHNYGLWSEWSAPLQMAIPARPPAGKMLVLMLVAGLGVATLLIICFRVIPQGKRIKAHFLPPIPKPRIGGIDPVLLKKGRLDEIDHHFRTFHSYSHPVLSEEVWSYVSTEDGFTVAPPSCALWPEQVPGGQWDKPANPPGEGTLDPPTVAAPLHPTPSTLNATSYCELPDAAYTRPVTAGQWEWPAVVVATAAVPVSDYSRLATQPSTPQPPEDFYTCAQLLGPSGEVNLVPCLTPTPKPRAPGREEQGDEELKKKRPPADCLAETSVSGDPN